MSIGSGVGFGSRAPRTEHHEGKGSRTIPLFPELREPLMEVFELAMSRTDGVKTVRDSDPVIVRYRKANANLRTQLQRILKPRGRGALAEAFSESEVNAGNRTGW